MKRIGFALVLVGVSVVGCLPLREQQRPPQVEMRPVEEPAAVMAEEVTEQNATEKAQALREELLRDGQRPAAAPDAEKK